jgi:ornithine decarboxylase
MISLDRLQELASEHGTPLFVVDHDEIRASYRAFRRHLPRVQAYYAVKANPDPAIVRTLFSEGASFDVASLPEFMIVYDNIKEMPARERQDWIWDKIIYANPTKSPQTLAELDRYKPLVTFDNSDEIEKIREFAPHAGLALRLRVPNTGAMVELNLSAHVFEEARDRGCTSMNLIDIGGGFPVPYDCTVKPFSELAAIISSELDRLFPDDIEVLAEPGRFLVASAGYVVSEVIGTAVRDGKRCYYVNDGVYHTYSGILFDHCQYPVKAFKGGPTQISAVFGPTCDALDMISMAENLPLLRRGDLVYSDMIGAYSHASATWFNGFPPATVVHVNQ